MVSTSRWSRPQWPTMAPRSFVVGPSRWQQFHIVCQYRNLTDPAKIVVQAQRAAISRRCNLACRAAVCPVVGCDVKSRAARRARRRPSRNSGALPPTVEACWAWDGRELSIEQPAEVSAATRPRRSFGRASAGQTVRASRSARPRRLEAEAAEGEEDVRWWRWWRWWRG